MSLQKRKAVYKLAQKYDILILEDNPYGEIRFKGEDIPSIKSFDTDGRVVYAGSFSKVLSPGMRLGYAIANKEIISKMTVCKQTDDVHTSMWSQLVAHRFMSEYDFEKHLMSIRSIYLEKAELCMSLMDKYLAPKVDYFKVEGVSSVTSTATDCRMTVEGTDMLEFCGKAIENRVAVVPGTAFSVDTNAISDRFRINYSTPTNQQIEDGIKILSSLLK